MYSRRPRSPPSSSPPPARPGPPWSSDGSAVPGPGLCDAILADPRYSRPVHGAAAPANPATQSRSSEYAELTRQPSPRATNAAAAAASPGYAPSVVTGPKISCSWSAAQVIGDAVDRTTGPTKN